MLLQHVLPLGGHLQVELRNLFYISVFAVLFIIFALCITNELRKMETFFFVLSVRKTISISLLWPRYMRLVLIAGLPPEGGGEAYCSVCVLLYAAVFVFLLVSRLGI